MSQLESQAWLVKGAVAIMLSEEVLLFGLKADSEVVLCLLGWCFGDLA